MVYVLWSQTLQCNRNHIRGMYTSKKKLAEGCAQGIVASPLEIFYWERWKINDFEGVMLWEWAYIPVEADVNILKYGGGWVPIKSYWGRNLVGLKRIEMEHEE